MKVIVKAENTENATVNKDCGAMWTLAKKAYCD